MGRLVIVSNRVSIPSTKKTAGGLAVALREALEKRGGVWCGWSGNISEDPQRACQKKGNIEYRTTDLTQKDHDEFYVGFSNSLLWPLFHYRPGLTHYNSTMFEGYERVNAAYAESVAGCLQRGDAVWVHDYQLITVGQHLRSRGVRQRIGFFLHIPFPVPEVLAALPVHQEILKALCCYDVIGFQTETDLQAFIRCVSTMMEGKKHFTTNGNTVQVEINGRTFTAGHFPISINTAEMVKTAARAEHAPETQQLRDSLSGRAMLIGVDRLDYTKGLPERLEAYHHFLQQYPEQKGQVTYVQITPPCRTDVDDYIELRKQIEGLAARINGVNANIDWVPIRYINTSFSRNVLAGFYRTARVGLVTPMRDGMNLVAKEYVASQNPENPGVLVLSQFAGAARELDAALLVNPFDTEAMGEALQQAITMPLEERKERFEAMFAALRGNDITHWTRSFLAELILEERRGTIEVPPTLFQELQVPIIRPDPAAESAGIVQ